MYDGLIQYQDTLDDYGRLLALNPTSKVFVERGKLLNTLGEIKAAAADFSSAIEIDDSNIEYYSERAACYAELSLDQKKYEQYEMEDNAHITQLDPDNEGLGLDAMESLLLYLKLTANEPYEESWDWREGIQMVDSYLTRCPLNSKVRAGLYAIRGSIYSSPAEKNSKYYDYVFRDCALALELFPSCRDAFLTRALALASLNRHSEAIVDYSESIKYEDWSCRVSLTYRGRSMAFTKDYRGAVDDFSKAIVQYTKDLEEDKSPFVVTVLSSLHLDRGRCLLAIGELDRANADFKHSLHFNSVKNGQSWVEANAVYWRGYISHLRGDQKLAEADFKRACQENIMFSNRPFEEVDPKDLPFDEQPGD